MGAVSGGAGTVEAVLVLGVDAGGSRTTAVVVEFGAGLQVAVLGVGRSGSGSRDLVGAAASENIHRAIVSALGGRDPNLVAAGAIGVAGPVGGAELGWSREFGADVPVRISGDLAVAFAGGTHLVDGSVVVAGSGSRAAAIVDGAEARSSGGWGWFLGDEGSGTWMGREVLRAVLGALQGVGPDTALRAAVAGVVGVDSLELEKRAVCALAYGGGPVSQAVGQLAPLVAVAAGAGDAVATRILDEAAAHLAGVVSGLDCAGPVVAGGSVATSAAMRGRLSAALGPVCFAPEAPTGAVVLAARARGRKVGAKLHRAIAAATEAAAGASAEVATGE